MYSSTYAQILLLLYIDIVEHSCICTYVCMLMRASPFLVLFSLYSKPRTSWYLYQDIPLMKGTFRCTLWSVFCIISTCIGQLCHMWCVQCIVLLLHCVIWMGYTPVLCGVLCIVLLLHQWECNLNGIYPFETTYLYNLKLNLPLLQRKWKITVYVKWYQSWF